VLREEGKGGRERSDKEKERERGAGRELAPAAQHHLIAVAAGRRAAAERRATQKREMGRENMV
jgi:hypothetical protein